VIRDWFGKPRVLAYLALASVAANVVIVVTGGAVRLTGSGLGCPTWPTCTGSSLTPSGPYSFHEQIEFTNRTLTFLLAAIAIATLIAAWRQRSQVRLAAIALTVIPVQAVIGGVSVLTDLNPWVVALHLIVSMANIAVTMVLWWRVSGHAGRVAGPLPAIVLARLIVVTAGALVVVGTVVTGSGPNSGAKHQSQRIDVNPSSVAQLHADLVMVLVGLTVGVVALLYAVHVSPGPRRAAVALLAVELAQGAIGYTQYFLDVPPLLVAVHMLGACAVWIAAWHLLLGLTGSQQLPDRMDQQADQRAHHRAVHPDELQVTPDL
jgi:heme a synthase